MKVNLEKFEKDQLKRVMDLIISPDKEMVSLGLDLLKKLPTFKDNRFKQVYIKISYWTYDTHDIYYDPKYLITKPNKKLVYDIIRYPKENIEKYNGNSYYRQPKYGQLYYMLQLLSSNRKFIMVPSTTDSRARYFLDLCEDGES